MKGVIPAAGRGTRMRPFTKAYPKELLPVGEKAVIEYCINDLKNAGITEICVVVGWKQHAILDYLGSGERLGVDITYKVQDQRDGLATAIKCAESFVGDDNFAVVLGDNYVDDKSALNDLKEFHLENGYEATIGTFRPEDVTSYGVIDPGEDNLVEGMIEKPSTEDAPSEMAISGLYIFESSIFDAVEYIGKGKGEEYQLTDAIDFVRKQIGDVGYREIKGSRIDVGTPQRLRQANKEFEHRN